MRRLSLLLAFMLCCQFAFSQVVVITTADMPVLGDTLRYSNAPVSTVIDPRDSGLSMSWHYTLTSVSQGVDTYKTAIAVDPIYTSINAGAYGYKTADTFLTLLPARNPYTFFENTTDSFIATGFAAEIAGKPTPANYSSPDVWYHFPLSYLRTDVDSFKLNIILPGIGNIHKTGYRHTRVDGFGSIITPYSSSATPCIRVRSQVSEVDSVTIGSITFPDVPRNTVEYKWLANGIHHPLLWVTSTVTGSTETITSVRYRDNFINTDTLTPVDTNLAVQGHYGDNTTIRAYPNPATEGMVTLSLPGSWKDIVVQVYNMQGREMATFINKRELDIRALLPGTYIARITSGLQYTYVQVVR